MLNMLNLSKGLKNLNQVKNMMNMVRTSQNPELMLQQMINNNPQMQQIMKYIQQNGGNAKDAFYNMAKEKGINPDEILAVLQQQF